MTVKKPKKNIFPITSYYRYQIIQLDIMDVSNVSGVNSKYKYLLIAVDIFTRVAFTVALKNKQSLLLKLQKKNDHFKPGIKIIVCDNSSEFLSKAHNIEIQFVDIKEHEIGRASCRERVLRLV